MRDVYRGRWHSPTQGRGIGYSSGTGHSRSCGISRSTQRRGYRTRPILPETSTPELMTVCQSDFRPYVPYLRAIRAARTIRTNTHAARSIAVDREGAPTHRKVPEVGRGGVHYVGIACPVGRVCTERPRLGIAAPIQPPVLSRSPNPVSRISTLSYRAHAPSTSTAAT